MPYDRRRKSTTEHTDHTEKEKISRGDAERAEIAILKNAMALPETGLEEDDAAKKQKVA